MKGKARSKGVEFQPVGTNNNAVQPTFVDNIIKNQIQLALLLIFGLAIVHTLVPPWRPQTGKLFSLSYASSKSEGTVYTQGIDDVYFVMGWILYFTTLRAITMEWVLQPLARLLGVKNRSQLRFAEQGWIFLYYSTMWVLGMFLWYNSVYWLDHSQLWTAWPSREMSGMFKYYYLVQLAFSAQLLLAIHMEVSRKDYVAMLTHHIITFSLISITYVYRYTRAANVVLCLMDFVDILLPFAKLLRYLRYETACNIAFGIFVVSWLMTRHILYLQLCWDIHRDVPGEKTMLFGCYNGSTNRRIQDMPDQPDYFAHLLWPFQDLDGVICLNTEVKYIFLGMLLLLHTLSSIWFVMILKVIVGILSGKSAEDIRSEDEGEQYADISIEDLNPCTGAGNDILIQTHNMDSISPAKPRGVDDAMRENVNISRVPESPTARRRLMGAEDAAVKEVAETMPFFSPPTYTMKQIHDAIPPHCFERNTFRSLRYIVRDLLYVASLFSVATQIHRLPSQQLRFVLWAAYSFTQGLVLTGLWELAHQCGHQALSPSKRFNNTAGWVIHSCLLVPYHSWRFTHAQHHKATNNIEHDIAFVPDTKEVWLAAREARFKSSVLACWEIVEDMPLVNLVILIAHQLIAWPSKHFRTSYAFIGALFFFMAVTVLLGMKISRWEITSSHVSRLTGSFSNGKDLYLIINNFALPRMRKYPWWTRSHFYFGDLGPNFRRSNRDDVILSTVGVLLVVGCIYAAAEKFGFHKVFLYYGMPWLWTNHWILTVTFLQHTDFSLPYYPQKTWSFLRGCASTIDRDFGFIGRHLLHGAIECHVLHHHASRIPFYHAQEASDAIQAVMMSHYKSDTTTPYIWAFWKNYNACRFVEEKDTGSGIYFFGKL
ncbi:hypothetical protein VTL71DRAFT_6697 [Oculimacula yallundae]|uniref:TLC domain-containing protein n=1 Tax=Oculimacula yallundae TaxID=86028 RepID=A0ABR4BZ86_9HELO